MKNSKIYKAESLTKFHAWQAFKAALAVAAVVIICGLLPDAPAQTKSDCVAYWSQRVQEWDNAPTIDTINNAAEFCGNIQQ